MLGVNHELSGDPSLVLSQKYSLRMGEYCVASGRVWSDSLQFSVPKRNKSLAIKLGGVPLHPKYNR